MAILNPSGTERTYTLPDASGTLALTSDLTGYVTLDTAQTITAQKTFSTSGGSDTAIINHGSGSGIALNITKAGNGEGLRVAKTSGTGNAVTITGGLLSAEAATLTGALNGTSASFSGDVGIGTDSPDTKLEIFGGARVSGNSTYAEFSLKDGTASGSTWYLLSGFPALGDFTIREAGVANHLVIKKTTGNVGIGTASPATNLHIAGTTEMRFGTTSSGSLIQFWKDSSASFASSIGNAIPGGSVQNDLLFATYDGSAWSEQMRITSEGYVLVGSDTIPGAGTTTIGSSLGTAGFITAQRNAATVGFFGRNSSDGELFAFYRDSTQVGNISVTSVLTTYNTTSDYRLKEDLQEFNGLEKVQAIKVYDYKWKAQESRMNGVLAHELAEVLPYAVSGEKDEVDEKGNDKMQGVDYSKIVPILIKAIQEQQVQIDSLKNQIK
jgi:hypothetical protein